MFYCGSSWWRCTSALAFLLPLVSTSLAIVPGIQLYVAAANDADWVWHIYCIIVLAFHGLLNDRKERIINVCVLDSGGFEVRHVTVALAPLLCFFFWDLAIFYLVAFVAHHHEWEGVWLRGTSMINKTIAPLLKLLEWFPLCQVKC